MSERMVRLDIGTQANARADSHSAQSGGGGFGERPTEEHVDQFRRALTGGDGESTPSGTTQSSPDAQITQARGVFGLFGGLGRTSPFVGELATPSVRGQQPTASSSAPSELFAAAGGIGAPAGSDAAAAGRAADDSGAADNTSRLASEVADRILVSADDDREARVFIRDEVMPGVEVRIAQEQGRWLVEFTISDSKSFEVLDQAGEKIANELAERLRSTVEVRLIATTDPAGTPASTYFANPTAGSGGVP
jgi:hypothetical protein